MSVFFFDAYPVLLCLVPSTAAQDTHQQKNTDIT